jgi:hypothetical protein
VKTCTKCKQEKPPTDFGCYARTKDGLDTQCKECRRAKLRTPESRNLPGNRRQWIEGMMKQLGPGDY